MTTKTSTITTTATSNFNPYPNVNGVCHKLFEAAKKGTTLAAYQAACTKAGIKPERVLREMKWNEYRGLSWNFTLTEDGRMKVSKVTGTYVATPTAEPKTVKAVVAKAAKAINAASTKRTKKAKSPKTIKAAVAAKMAEVKVA